MDIREIQAGDLENLLSLYTHLHDNPVPERTPDLLALWERILGNGDHHIIVAEEKGSIVSSCVLVVVPNLTRGQRPYGLIENVVTHREHRKRGLASACLAFARELARQAGCYKLMLMTGSKEEATLRFYREAGFNAEDKTAFVQWL
ncbi:MAG: GNAT family N-acetyltransferase [Oscillospiraceae bacterium]|nr:GNAT family N-acetyltransferase [Oscillospiraceae bacterium]